MSLNADCGPIKRMSIFIDPQSLVAYFTDLLISVASPPGSSQCRSCADPGAGDFQAYADPGAVQEISRLVNRFYFNDASFKVSSGHSGIDILANPR
jgi:hypothetical protein